MIWPDILPSNIGYNGTLVAEAEALFSAVIRLEIPFP